VPLEAGGVEVGTAAAPAFVAALVAGADPDEPTAVVAGVESKLTPRTEPPPHAATARISSAAKDARRTNAEGTTRADSAQELTFAVRLSGPAAFATA
jgi:hypothetical protein